MYEIMTLTNPFSEKKDVENIEEAMITENIKRIDEIVGKGLYDDELIEIVHLMLNKV
jgi:hypothetical protein